MSDMPRAVIDTEATARHLRSLCEQRKVTPKMIAEILGFSSVTSIYKWLQGKSLPAIDNAVVLREYFGITLDDIYLTKHL